MNSVVIIPEERNPRDLKIHELYRLMNIIGPDAFEIKNYARYELIDRVLITDDGFIIANATYVEIAIARNMDKIIVDVMRGVEEEDIIRLINMKHKRFIKSKTAMMYVAKYLENYWSAGKGKDYYNEIPGHDTRDKIIYLLGTSTGTFQASKKIFEHSTELLEKVDCGEVTRDHALNQANKAEVDSKAYKPKGAQFKNANEELPTPADQVENKVFKLTTLVCSVQGYGEIIVKFIDDDVLVTLNDEIIDRVNCSFCPPPYGETFHFLMQFLQLGSIHIMGAGFRNSADAPPENDNDKKKKDK